MKSHSMRALFPTILLASCTTLCCLAQTTGYPASSIPSAAVVPAPGSPYAAGVQARFAATGDFNGDGLPDLALLNYGEYTNNSVLIILLATKNGALVPGPGGPISLGSNNGANNTGLVVADFNRDGNLDIATTNAYDLEVWLGNGNGGFTPAPASPIDITGLGLFGASVLGVGDFNRDGILDLLVLVGAQESDVAILLGKGDGSFTMSQWSPIGVAAQTNNLTVADFNRDGNLDVAFTCVLSNQVIVLLGDGTGRLLPDPKGPFPTGFLPLSIVHADFNDDGKIDLAVANETSLTVLLGDGTGGFAAQPDMGLAGAYGLNSLAVGDLDGDGKLDLAISNSDDPISNVFVLLGDGTGAFQPAASGPINSPGGPYAVTLADFNHDGRLDIAVANNESGTVSVFLGTPTAVSSLALTTSSSPAVAVPFPVTANVNTSGFHVPTGTVTVVEAATLIGTQSLIDGSAVFQTTLGTAGFQALSGTYSGDSSTLASASPGLTVDLAQGSQTISFPAPPKHSLGDPPFAVTASSSSGLPVTITVVSGPAAITGNVVTLTGAGLVVLEASQPGNANYLPAPSVQQNLQIAAPSLQLDAVVNAASYGVGSFAPDSFAVLFGADLASPATASGGLTPNLGGSSIQLKDASGKTASALLYYASPAQINFILPSSLGPGKGTLTLTTQAGSSVKTAISIAAVSPGLFSADSTGTGVAAGNALRVSADGTQTPLPISSCSGMPLVCTAVPINLGGPTDTVYLSLYGTGIRGRSALSAVTATIGGLSANVLYSGAQPDYQGLDQVNLQLDPSLRGRGTVPVAISVDVVAANVVNVAIQ